MSSLRVSVIIPTYQRAALIGETLQSVFAQTYTDWEIVIGDDGSTDNIEQVVAEYGPRVRFFRQANAGPSAARNLAVRHACGEWLAFLDSDDLWTPDKLQLQLELADAKPDLQWIYCDTDYFGSDRVANSLTSFQKVPPARGWILEHMLKYSVPMRTSTFMMTKNLFDRIGGFDEKLRTVEDQDLCFRAAELAEADYVDRVLVHYRRGEDRPLNKRYSANSWWRYVAPRKRALDAHPEIAARLTPAELRRSYTQNLYEVIISAAQERDHEMITRSLTEIRRWEPWSPRYAMYAVAAWSPRLFLLLKRPGGHV